MGTKTSPGKFDCYAKLADDEPYFLLRGKDPLASFVVRYWAVLRNACPNYEHSMDEEAQRIIEAEDCARAMENYHGRRGGDPEFESVASVMIPAIPLSEAMRLATVELLEVTDRLLGTPEDGDRQKAEEVVERLHELIHSPS